MHTLWILLTYARLHHHHHHLHLYSKLLSQANTLGYICWCRRSTGITLNTQTHTHTTYTLLLQIYFPNKMFVSFTHLLANHDCRACEREWDRRPLSSTSPLALDSPLLYMSVPHLHLPERPCRPMIPRWWCQAVLFLLVSVCAQVDPPASPFRTMSVLSGCTCRQTKHTNIIPVASLSSHNQDQA